MKVLTHSISALILILGLIACKKDQPAKPISNSFKNEAIKTENLINSFKSRISSGLKSTDSIPVDSAEWYLGSAINYTYGDATSTGSNLSVDSMFFSFHYEGDYLPIRVASEFYDDIVDSIRAHYYSVESINRHLLAVIVQQTSRTAQEIDFKIVSIVVYNNFGNTNWTFNDTDNWKWWNEGGNNGGYCAGPYYQTALESDAAEQIQQKVMFRKPLPVGTYCYIQPMDIVDINASAYPNPNHSGSNNYYYYYLYKNSTQWPDCHTCLLWEEMNFYLLGAEHIVYTANNDPNDPGARPPSQSFMTIDLRGDMIPSIPYTSYFHYGTVFYGTLQITGGLPDNL